MTAIVIEKTHYCTNKDILELLDICPLVIEQIKKKEHIYRYLYDAYEDVANQYGISLGVAIVYKGDTDNIHHYDYWYKYSDVKVDTTGVKGFKTFAKAQLEVIHQTMYELENRINHSTNGE